VAGCIACQRSKYAPQLGSAVCDPCPPGNYCPYTGMGDALPCPKGTYGALNVLAAAGVGADALLCVRRAVRWRGGAHRVRVVPTLLLQQHARLSKHHGASSGWAMLLLVGAGRRLHAWLTSLSLLALAGLQVHEAVCCAAPSRDAPAGACSGCARCVLRMSAQDVFNTLLAYQSQHSLASPLKHAYLQTVLSTSK
jgi:hypothetical protein